MVQFFVFIVNMLCIINGSIKWAELFKLLPWVGHFIQNMPQRENEVLEACQHQEDTRCHAFLISAGLVADFLHSSNEGHCASQVWPCQSFFSRQLVVVQSDVRGQRSVVNQSCTEQRHLLICQGWEHLVFFISLLGLKKRCKSHWTVMWISYPECHFYLKV